MVNEKSEERETKVMWPGLSRGGGNLYNEITTEIRQLISEFGNELEDSVSGTRLSIFSFPLFREFNLIGGITDTEVLVAISPSNGMPMISWFDWSKEQPPLRDYSLLSAIKEQMGWESVTVLPFDKALLKISSENRKEHLRELAKKCVQQAQEQMEKQARIVRLKPIFNGRDFLIENDLCFVLMPFKEPFYRLYNDHVKPTLEGLKLRVAKADDVFNPSPIMEDIWEYINKARIIVADVTGRNPNVFYELGIAHTVGKEVIILTQDPNDVPFDLRHLRYFVYQDNQAGWTKLTENLRKAVEAVVRNSGK